MQDVLLQLKQQVIGREGSSPKNTRAILGKDRTKPLDQVRHKAILQNTEKLGFGNRTYDYVANFVRGRVQNYKAKA